MRTLEGARCRTEGCDRPHHARGLCKYHYQHQWYASRRPVRDEPDIDPVAVQRVICGEPTPCNKHERREAIRALWPRASYTRMAHLTGVTPRTIHRDLRELGLVHQRGAVA